MSRAITPAAACASSRSTRNHGERYPADSYEAMRERVPNSEKWPLPYLHDSRQDVARAYGAKTTPDVFVVDSEGRLRYRGAPDADHSDPSQNAAWLRGALDAILEGRDPEPAETKAGRLLGEVEVSRYPLR